VSIKEQLKPGFDSRTVHLSIISQTTERISLKFGIGRSLLRIRYDFELVQSNVTIILHEAQ
jgi:hypothetical protein